MLLFPPQNILGDFEDNSFHRKCYLSYIGSPEVYIPGARQATQSTAVLTWGSLLPAHTPARQS